MPNIYIDGTPTTLPLPAIPPSPHTATHEASTESGIRQCTAIMKLHHPHSNSRSEHRIKDIRQCTAIMKFHHPQPSQRLTK